MKRKQTVSALTYPFIFALFASINFVFANTDTIDTAQSGNLQDTNTFAVQDTAYAQDSDTQAENSAAEKLKTTEHELQDHDGHYGYDFGLKKGKRLFYGMAKTESGSQINCASCHNTKVIDTLNWNPSAYEIALSSHDMDSATFAAVLMNPATKRLTETHEGIKLNGAEMELIRKYLNDVKESGLETSKPHLTQLIFFFILLALFLGAFGDLLFFKKIKNRAILSLIILGTSVWMVKMMAHEAIALGRSEGYAPLQPIKFSHKIHATDNKIDCMYCHHSAEGSKSAGIPSANVCLNCHTLVREGTNSGRFEIDKIHAAVDSGMPIEWIRVHRLPDFVFFSHAQHVGVGKLDCRECHGAVEEMDVLEQYSDLSMGWCLDCHRTRQVQFVENDYYGLTYEEYHNKIVNGEMDSVTVAEIGGTDCMKCHY